jgi:hypothetical protein
MNDNEQAPLSEPEFDPHYHTKPGCLFGALLALLVIGVVCFVFL